ncbi:MAG: hypothetical protein QXK49_03655 [Candidatus Aenigmatarchaeota archaeon]
MKTSKELIENIGYKEILKYQNKNLLNLYIHYKFFELFDDSHIPNYVSNITFLIVNLLAFGNGSLIIEYKVDHFNKAVETEEIYPRTKPISVWKVKLDEKEAFGEQLGPALARLLIKLKNE